MEESEKPPSLRSKPARRKGKTITSPESRHRYTAIFTTTGPPPLRESQIIFPKVAEHIQDATVYLDAGSTESFQFLGAYPILLELGARAICSLENMCALDVVSAGMPIQYSLLFPFPFLILMKVSQRVEKLFEVFHLVLRSQAK
ncbi:hypothetical protein V8G54_024831 [Vigna mungo]|uniref:Uncharacterized protein n=1 Tax=Vigna mungo TaxID=3915 RepID=A0AAQ3N733_VIGMU